MRGTHDDGWLRSCRTLLQLRLEPSPKTRTPVSWEASDEIVTAYGKYETALHWACYYDAPLEVIREIAKASEANVVFRACWHEHGTALDCLLINFYDSQPFDALDKVKAIVEGNKEAAAFAVWTAFRVAADTDTKDMFEIFSYMTKVAYYDKFDVEDLPLAHAVAAFPHEFLCSDGMNWTKCPDRALELSIRHQPEELQMADEDGNLPLHLASNHQKPYRKKDMLELEMEWELAMENEDPDFPGCGDDADYNSSKVELLLEAYPEAARVKNGAGKLPFNLAVESGKSECIKSLLDAYPEADEK